MARRHVDALALGHPSHRGRRRGLGGLVPGPRVWAGQGCSHVVPLVVPRA